jgi:hypothetical protein
MPIYRLVNIRIKIVCWFRLILTQTVVMSLHSLNRSVFDPTDARFAVCAMITENYNLLFTMLSPFCVCVCVCVCV